MPETRYLALLRGINVGGSNIIKMAELKECFEGMGLSGVATYIQSGNVIFKSPEGDKEKLTKKIEKKLSGRFGYESRIVLVSREELREIVEGARPGFGSDADQYRYDVIFLKEPLTPAEAMKNVSTREGVDTAHAGKYALYFSRLISRATQSRLSRIIALPEYQYMTIRNWTTTTKLLALMEAADQEAGGEAAPRSRKKQSSG